MLKPVVEKLDIRFITKTIKTKGAKEFFIKIIILDKYIEIIV